MITIALVLYLSPLGSSVQLNDMETSLSGLLLKQTRDLPLMRYADCVDVISMYAYRELYSSS